MRSTRWNRFGILGLAVALGICAPGVSPSRAKAEEPITTAEPAPGTKYSVTAFAASFFGTALPCVASSVYIDSKGEASEALAGFPILAAYLGGPSLGHFYAGRPKRALVGVGIRSAAAVGFAIGLGIEAEKSYDAPSANTLMLLSVMVGLGSTVVDVFDAPHSVTVHNAELGHSRINLTPAAVGVARAPGVRVDVTF